MVNAISQRQDFVAIQADVVNDAAAFFSVEVHIPLTQLSGTVAQFNTALTNAIKTTMQSLYGIVVQASEKVMLLGGAV
jgi:hypothetical protein